MHYRVPKECARQSQFIERIRIEATERIFVGRRPAVFFRGQERSRRSSDVGVVLRVDVGLEDLGRIAAKEPEPIFNDAAAKTRSRENIGTTRLSG